MTALRSRHRFSCYPHDIVILVIHDIVIPCHPPTRYAAYNHQEFDKVRICVGSLQTCETIKLGRLYRKAAYLFNGPYVDVPDVNQFEDLFEPGAGGPSTMCGGRNKSLNSFWNATDMKAAGGSFLP